MVVAVSCPHRHQAFEACRWLIDTLKEVVPIWKKEIWADGTEEWVHPGLEPARSRRDDGRFAARGDADDEVACERLGRPTTADSHDTRIQTD